MKTKKSEAETIECLNESSWPIRKTFENFSELECSSILQNLIIIKIQIEMAEPKHPVYTIVQTKEEADLEAWVYYSPAKLERRYFKFPELAETEVRINISNSGICRTDWSISSGHWGDVDCFYPICPGHEIIGVVSKVGSKVTSVKPGDKVTVGPFRDHCGKCSYCRTQNGQVCVGLGIWDRLLYGPKWGGYATGVQILESHVFKLPEGMDVKEAPPLLCAGVTVFAPLQVHCNSLTKLAVCGIGGLGHLALRYAKAMGIEAVAISSSKEPSRIEEIKNLGATEVIHMSELSKHANRFDVMLNTSPDQTKEEFSQLLSTLRPEGNMVLLGIAGKKEGLEFSIDPVAGWSRRITGSLVGGVEMQRAMLRFSSVNNIYPINEHFKFEDFDKAVEKMKFGRPQFRCVVDVEEYSKANGLWK